MLKQIPGFESYSVSDEGLVVNTVTGVAKKPTLNKSNGYLYVDLYKDGKRAKKPIHRLVAEAFGVSLGSISLMLKAGTIGRRGKMRGYKFEYENGKRATHRNV